MVEGRKEGDVHGINYRGPSVGLTLLLLLLIMMIRSVAPLSFTDT